MGGHSRREQAALDAEMAGLLGRLLAVVKVAVISGRDFSQFEQQALTNRISITSESGYVTLAGMVGTRL